MGGAPLQLFWMTVSLPQQCPTHHTLYLSSDASDAGYLASSPVCLGGVQ